ncbi:EAP30/Vps36 family vacuolar-sorting protein [Alkalihalobacterium alkalinitrilicum]|nr:EAP30/Vps36 family vacuolar-sorting protein [Alkalihalobacterium alkalinitrilicum]
MSLLFYYGTTVQLADFLEENGDMILITLDDVFEAFQKRMAKGV